MEEGVAKKKKLNRREAWISHVIAIQSRNTQPKEINHSAPNQETSLAPPRCRSIGGYKCMGDQSSVIDFKFCMYARQGKIRYLNLLRSIMVEAGEEYLNLKRKSTSENNGSYAGKNLDGSNVLNDSNILQRLFCDVLNVYVNTLTPDARYQIISHFQRISLEVKQRYLNIDEGCSSETKDLVEDKAIYDITNVSWTKPPENDDAFVSSEGKKYKNGFRSIINDFFPNCIFPEGLLLAQSLFCAKTALEFYNDKRGTDYKLVEPLSSSRYLESVLRFHCNFFASKVKKNGSWTRPKLFFGSFLLSKNKIIDIHCNIINPATAFYMCCEFCPPDLAHSTHPCHRYGIFGLFARNLKDHTALKNRIYAKMALKFLNKKHGTKFKLVKSLGSSILPVSYGVYKFHCNFKAKLENTESSESDDDSPKKYLFFGDIIKSTFSTEGEFYILENIEDLDDHCSICQNGVLHPAHYRNSGHSS
ncbi:unnamed protein product [Amaranthus hypochondriacus]